MRIQGIVIRIFRQFFHDKRSLALMFVAPIMILWLISLVFNGEDYHPKIAVIDVPDTVISALEKVSVEIIDTDKEKAEKSIKDGELDAILSFVEQNPTLQLEGSDPTANKAVVMKLKQALEKANPSSNQFQLETTYLYGNENMAAFDNFGPVLVGYFAFFFVFLLSGVAFLRERTAGTLERLLATPLRRWEIVVGYIIGFGLFTMIQAGLIVWFSIKVLNMMMVGSFWYVLLVTLILALSALTLGTFLSAFANNEFQMIQFIPIVIIPQVFFSGLFNMDTMAEWLKGLGLVMPLTYAAEALRDIMIRGKGWEDIAVNIYILISFCIFFTIANILALKKHRSQ